MDGENFMKNLIKMDDLGGFPPIFGNTQMQKARKLVLQEISDGRTYERTDPGQKT